MKPTSILVVTADRNSRAAIAQGLRRADGYILNFSSDVSSGMFKLADACYETVIAEHDMPETNGLEFLKRVRCGDGGVRRETPFAMLASFASHDVLSSAIALDLTTLLLKPITPRDVAQRMIKISNKAFEPKSIAEYAEVEVPRAPLQRQIQVQGDGRSPVAALRPLDQRADLNPNGSSARSPADQLSRRFGPQIRRSLEALEPGWQIAEDVVSPTGARLVGAGTILTDRLLKRLRDFGSDGRLGDVWARSPLS